MKKFICPVCQFDGLKEEPFDSKNNPSHEICPKCKFEFGFDGGNDPKVFKEYHQRWAKSGDR